MMKRQDDHHPSHVARTARAAAGLTACEASDASAAGVDARYSAKPTLGAEVLRSRPARE